MTCKVTYNSTKYEYCKKVFHLIDFDLYWSDNTKKQGKGMKRRLSKIEYK